MQEISPGVIKVIPEAEIAAKLQEAAEIPFKTGIVLAGSLLEGYEVLIYEDSIEVNAGDFDNPDAEDYEAAG